MSILDQIDTIVVVMMENRSFDHMLGYLSHPLYGNWKNVNGQRTDKAWLARYTNTAHGEAAAPFRLTRLYLSGDPPHERRDIRVQIGSPYPWGDSAPMTGFMTSYATNPRVPVSAYGEVMGFFTSYEAPMTGFLAENFTICDHWFACLPASTQPNRLMAMSGIAKTDNTFSSTVPDQDLVYDWCDGQSPKVRWRVYHEGWPFFMVMNKWRAAILEDAIEQNRFRALDKLEKDFCSNDPFPQVVFVEPKYTDDHFSTPAPSDDHPPTSIAGGQAFLKRVYEALTSNPVRWSRTVMVVTYDENGGFFDHVSPIPVPTVAPDGSYTPFQTSGVRVPSFVVSPLVRAGGVYNGPLDHSSILKFIGEKFGRNGLYSPEVNGRPIVGSVIDVLKDCAADPLRADLPAAPPVNSDNIFAHSPADRIATPTSLAFEHALSMMRREQPDKAAQKFPELAAYFNNPVGELLQLAQSELNAKGVVLDSGCESMFQNFVEQAEIKLSKDPDRAYLARANLTEFVNRMVAEAHGKKTISAQNFQAARQALPLWPFI